MNMWSGMATKNKDFFNYQENQVTVTMHTSDTPATEQKPQKERPVWMTESTVEGAITEAAASVSRPLW